MSAGDAADSFGIELETLYRWLRTGLYLFRRVGPGPKARLWVAVDPDGFPVDAPPSAARRPEKQPRRRKALPKKQERARLAA
jgi:hypothetical protein